jgi:pyroglutamyl-peptidase
MACWPDERGMSSLVGLITGSKPFAGMADNPAQKLLSSLHGASFAGFRIETAAMECDLATLPGAVSRLIADIRPAFVISLGLALGSPVIKVETTAINRLSFAVADNEGGRPTDGRPIEAAGPHARMASWPAQEIADGLLDAGLPALVSHFAGTHLCNATLYTALGAMETSGLSGPVGFLHLPYLPSQVACFLRSAPAEGDHAPLRQRDLASMSLADQEHALSVVLAIVAGQAKSMKGT